MTITFTRHNPPPIWNWPNSRTVRVVWMVGAASVGRYLLLGATEHNVLTLIDGTRTPQQICETFLDQHGGKLSAWLR